ncbi:hypothetical protein [Tuwongella immobilis]|uniref:NfeD-like C-terminal domain-containing protein n=1 Tax=Tuwongella immobilis TaxID=692036 RepID=A0A6C2YIY3_9BACT|nr:hypothetical protein [Tuwongella immobilis]VIP01508.1 Uncharacterized protein OS=Blastopirellula marina DSM 3645 GN=DSM3645_05475 PE=4 SV=1 [Tuwongella immobilis]VTR98616.1 Uncharacterized protein OS=Blastopirellula marina DSM 3645 GN=DSM3645_05475 PE=4 SV=1 [Tuwongella immobilis]
MDSVYLFCVVIGGVVLLLQTGLLLLGLGDDHGHLSHSTDSGDTPSDWWWSLLSVRTLTAGATFFGLGGMLARGAEIAGDRAVLIALACGGAAMYAVNALVQWLLSFQADHTVSLNETIGCQADIYLRIPPNRTGRGKVMLTVRNRTLELDAMTEHGVLLPTGGKAIVLSVEPGETLLVGPVESESQTNQETLTHV